MLRFRPKARAQQRCAVGIPCERQDRQTRSREVVMRLRHRRRASHWAAVKRWKSLGARRILAAVVVGCSLTWLVVTSSLPFALIESNPEFALWLDPDNPNVRVALADRARKKLIALESRQENVL